MAPVALISDPLLRAARSLSIGCILCDVKEGLGDMELCRKSYSGIFSDDDRLHWTGLAGRWSKHVEALMPRPW